MRSADAQLDDILERLRASGGRITSARRALVTALLSYDGHPTAEGLAAAGAGGAAEGLVLLCCFLVGLLTSNSLIAAAGTFGFLGASRNWPLYVGVSLVTAVFSLVIGAMFLTGNTTFLPAFFGG